MCLNANVYKDKVPDLAFVFAQRILARPSLITADDFGPTIRFLQKGCKPGAVRIRNIQNNRSTVKEVDLFERKFTAGKREGEGLREGIDFEWEVYQPWQDTGKGLHVSRPYAYIESRYMRVEGGRLIFTKLFHSTYRVFTESSKVCHSTFEDLREFAAAVQYYLESGGGAGSGGSVSCVCGCSGATASKAAPEYPWSSPEHKSGLRTGSIADLARKCHRPGTLEGVIYRERDANYATVAAARARPIRFAPGQQFRFTSFCGTGIETPMHVVFARPVRSHAELLDQFPAFTYSDGDGTVLLQSALADGVPAAYVHDRVVLRGADHFQCLRDDGFIRTVGDLLQDIQSGLV